jgi:hypothetical protein
MKFARKHQGIALNHSTGNDSMPEATEMQRLLEAVLEITDNKQSKAEIGGSKGNRSYAQKKRDKVDGETVRDENVTCFAMSVDQNMSSGEKIVPKKAKKTSPSDSIAGLQEMAEKKHESTQEKLLIAGKKLDFAERKEERRSKDMVERFSLEHRRIDTQQQQQQQQQHQQQQLELQQQQQQQQQQYQNKQIELQQQQQQQQMQLQQQQIEMQRQQQQQQNETQRMLIEFLSKSVGGAAGAN